MNMEREGQQAVFTNTGNANYLLTDGQQCDPFDANTCVALEDRRIYPGNTWTLDLPFDGAFTYKIRTRDGLVSEYFR